MNKIKLSISIPSNNKVKYLISAIESIVSEVNNKKSIEINPSCMATFQVLNENYEIVFLWLFL